jgi:hypothetical protein
MSDSKSPRLSYFAALSPEDRAEFVADLTNKKLTAVFIAQKWTAKTGNPITSMSIGRYQKKPEFAAALGQAANRASLAVAFDKAVRRGVEPALTDIGEKAREVYELAKLDPKRNYKAMTDSLAILLDMTKLDAEVQGLIGGGVKQESNSKGNTLHLSQMIILPRTGPLQVQGKAEAAQIEGHVEDAEWEPVEEDMRLLEDDDGEE